MFQEKFFIKLYYRIRFGKITIVTKEIVNEKEAEFEILDRKGKKVGYWAYGKYDPSYPYHRDI